MNKKLLFLILIISTILIVLLSIFQLNKSSNSTAVNDIAYFAGGCFWCTEADFEKLTGVIDVKSGYMGGEPENATYKKVAAGVTKHRETVQVQYDSSKISYEDLVQEFFMHHDPTDDTGSFYDRGYQYTSAIYYINNTQKKIALNIIKKLSNTHIFPGPIVTSIEKATTFYEAEEYHQDYYKKSPDAYNKYRKGSGRDKYIEQIWTNPGITSQKYITAPEVYTGFWDNAIKPSTIELQNSLSTLEYNVTQENGTERPFIHEYYNKKDEGIYVDKTSGEPLFSSTHKYKSGTGWPSFYRPISDELIELKEDNSIFNTRVEVRSSIGDNHIGHIFQDGPKPTGLRYCMNAAALTFIPKEDMATKGYTDLLILFEN